MSATILKDRVTQEIVHLLNDNAAKMLNLRYTPAQGATVNGSGGGTAGAGVIPASSAEQIGLQAAELNAERRALMQAAQVLEEQHKALIAPDVDDDAPAQTNGTGRPEPIYG